jgi:hypothetical protein
MTTQAFVCDALRMPIVRYALCTMCIGVGQDIVPMFERV